MVAHIDFGADDRGVSPVIGVVLMIAITVALSAAAGTLVLQLTDEQTGELSGDADAEFTVTFGTDSVEVTHTGGDAVPAEEILIDGDVDDSQRWGEYGSVSEGDSVTVDASGSNRTIVVVHTGPYGEEEVFTRVEE
ncbi:type IV pilin [Halorubrum aethiopicum]|uniref:type IV pilin n=1 Tax=Halorubrum aethiopicum TaxID=1758255 RepID=UPI0009B5A787|nr:type IV pilin N-terminal domain-containing protein [Halorubrum aethiopicum]